MGKPREELSLAEMEKVIGRAAYNEEGAIFSFDISL